MMLTTTNVHDVTSIEVSQRKLKGSDECWITVVTAKNAQHQRFELTLFSASPINLDGAEFVNFTNTEPA